MEVLQKSGWTYKANSSRKRRLYCFLGLMVLKYGSLITSGQAAGHGLPHKRLTKTKHKTDGECNSISQSPFPSFSIRATLHVYPEIVRNIPDQLKLQKLLVCLENWFLGEEFSQNTPLHNSKKKPKQHLYMNSSLCLNAVRWETDRTSYPQLQTSIAGEYLSSPSSSSGGRYHSVITLLV